MTREELKASLTAELDQGTTPVTYTADTLERALNEALRWYSILTLCVERTQPVTARVGQTWYSMLAEFPDWIVPLRVARIIAPVPTGFDQVLFDTAMFDENNTGPTTPVRLRPMRLTDIAGKSRQWSLENGPPTRYGCVGCDQLFLSPRPAVECNLSVTFAAIASPLLTEDAVPEIPERHHPVLVDFAVSLLRMMDGGKEMARAMSRFKRFLDAAKVTAGIVRARSRTLGYDRLPAEMKWADFSRALDKMQKESK